LVRFSKDQYKDNWQKRIAEDIVVVLGDIQHPINADGSVSLELAGPNAGDKKFVEHASLTEENRRKIMEFRLNQTQAN